MLSQHGRAPFGVKVYSCSSCNYKCIDRNRFEEHEAKHTGKMMQDRYREEYVSLVIFNFSICTICPTEYIIYMQLCMPLHGLTLIHRPGSQCMRLFTWPIYIYISPGNPGSVQAIDVCYNALD